MRSSRIVSVRAVSILAVALVAVMLVAGISPGATKFLTKKKALKLFPRKADVYTKTEIDNVFGKTFFRRSAPVAIGGGGVNTAEVDCPVGTEAVGGGGFGSGPGIAIGYSIPSDGTGTPSFAGAGFTGWAVGAFSVGPAGAITAYVVCQDAKTTDSNYSSGVTPRQGSSGWGG